MSVNVDHVATIREARKTNEPDPVAAAALVELAGGDGVTVHLREDRRHIQDRDLRILRETAKLPLNLEMAATEEMIGIALEIEPDQVTIVPEQRQEVTTEGGLDAVGQEALLAMSVQSLNDSGIPVSLFIDPDRAQIEASKRSGAKAVELHTGEYALIRGEEQKMQLARIAEMAKFGASLDLEIHAGHGLTYQNIFGILTVPEITELYIGHSIVSRAVLVGMERAVRDMLHLFGR